MMKKNRGFTLIEIMAVVAILALLATVVSVAVVDRLERAKVRLTKATIVRLKNECQGYKLEENRYPDQLQDLVEHRYLEQVPPDGWERPFQYANPGVRGPYDIVSYGSDGRPGGKGYDEDLWSHPPR